MILRNEMKCSRLILLNMKYFQGVKFFLRLSYRGDFVKFLKDLKYFI